VLSLEDGKVLGSIALKRVFQNKLSVRWRGKSGLISSGYTQGLIDDFAEVRKASEEIARSLDSRGPLNIQGRVMNGVFMPFELNPRFSASTYLRAKAGLNEVDIFVRALQGVPFRMPSSLRYGYYLRSFSEVFVPKEFSIK
jgi:carbamoyl-phosphate synthase large subunit